jgi:ribokinase
MRAVTFGSAMVDTIAVIHSDDIERMKLTNAESSYLLLREGSKTDAQAISTHTGGGAINTAVSFTRLGCEASPVIKIGDDLRGQQVRETLTKERLSSEFVMVARDHPTGSSVHVASHERNAAIFTFRGANTTLNFADLQNAHFKSDILMISGLSGASAACFPEIITRGRAGGAFVSVNPGIRQMTTRLHEFKSALKDISLLSLNKEEAAQLHDLIDPVHKFTLERFFQDLAAIPYVLLTDGSNGATLKTPKGMFHQPIIKVKVAGTAGAGDAFVSTLTHGLVAGFTPEISLLRAAHNAASVVTVVDTTSGLLDNNALPT